MLFRRSVWTVAVEGNIGSGKSTFLNFFQQLPVVQTLQEPVERWTSVAGKGHNALSVLYKDPSRWSFLFNQYAMLTRFQQHQLETSRPVKMMERSLYSTHNVFVQNSLQSGYLSQLEFEVLSEWFSYLVGNRAVHVNLFVYLQTSPEVCLERVRRRARKEETAISLNFLTKLHHLHEEMMVQGAAEVLPAPVLVLDANQEPREMFKIYSDKKEEILCGAT